MEVKNLINLTLDKKKKNCFIDETIKINIYRGKLYSKFIIFIEVTLSLTDVFLNYNKSMEDFKFNSYLLMYLIMVIVNIIYLSFLKKVDNCPKNLNIINIVIISYVTFMMVWGAVVSLMDQKLYGQIIVYMVNVITCSVIYYIGNKTILFSYFISAFILFLGLPFFQESKNVIIGHYINGVIFLSCAYLASRILYKNLYNDLKSKSLVIEANKRLKIEIEENKVIYKQLEKANKKLEKLSLNDDLTDINNRRALRGFIENIFGSITQEETPISIIMMDIDNFKLYNDNYGHIKGDEVLKKISGELREVLREPRDFVARYGGEEFIYIALETDEDEIYNIANKIREKIYKLKIVHGYSKISSYVTISLGTATIIPSNTKSIYECIKKADFALYQAKIEGKDRVESYNIYSRMV